MKVKKSGCAILKRQTERYISKHKNMKTKCLAIGLLLLALQAQAQWKIPETPFTTYAFDAKECKVIQHQNSRIFIPSYAFYLDGKPYEGEVQLQYRQFLDQLDILLNHIPMAYHENDRQHTLESGGMFELMAYGKGKLLSFAPDKKINVQLEKKFAINGGETFILDRNKGSWYKDTPFGNQPAANQQLPDSKAALWGDNFWVNADQWWSEPMWVVDPVTGAQTMQVVAGSSDMELRNQAFSTLQVDQMAMYNVDKILEEERIPLIVEFPLKGKNQLLQSEVYVVYKNRNAMLSYQPSSFQNGFELLPDEPFTIFSVSKDGKVAVADADVLAGLNVRNNKGKKVSIPMQVVDKPVTSKEELALLTGL